MADYKQYDPKSVSVILGVVPIRGFADDTMVTVSFDEPKRSKHIGVDGEGRHIKNGDRSGTVTVHLADYSPSNATITGLDALDEPFPITIVDKKSNGDLFFAGSCALQEEPDFVKGKEAQNNEYVFQFIKGNAARMGAKEI